MVSSSANGGEVVETFDDIGLLGGADVAYS